MEFDPVHIHKTRVKSHSKVLFLVLPVLIYVLILTFFMYERSRRQVSISSFGGAKILGTQKLQSTDP